MASLGNFTYRFEDGTQKSINEMQTKHAPDPGSGKTAYLTFDDGPSEFTPRLLEILKKNNVKATFFVSFQGEDTAEKRKTLKQEADEGNAIGIHSWSHDYFEIYANEENFLNDFNKMRRVIRAIASIDPKISRFPGGTGNTVSLVASCGHTIMPQLVRDVEAMGIKPFDWNAGGQDADLPHPTPTQLVRDILSESAGRANLVILLHDTHPSSIEAVPELVQTLRTKGYVFKVLDPDSPPVRQPPATRKEVLIHLKKSYRLIGDFIDLLESR